MLGRILSSRKQVIDAVKESDRPLVTKSLRCRDTNRLEKTLKACSLLKKVPKDNIKSLLDNGNNANAVRRVLNDSTEIKNGLYLDCGDYQ